MLNLACQPRVADPGLYPAPDLTNTDNRQTDDQQAGLQK